MIEYDEYGRPLPPHVYGGRSRSTNPILAESGINTEGAINEVAENQRNDFLSGERQFAQNTGQQMPQQFGVEEPVRNDEAPLTPQEVAEKMPATTQDMNTLLKQHLLPMHPQAKKDGYQNYITAKNEKEAAEKQQRQLQAPINRQAAAEKSQRAWDQTLALNALQGRGPGFGGLSGGSGGDQTSFGGGPRVQNIGGFRFVRGQWRQMTPEEQANVRMKNASADYTAARPGIEADENASRERIAQSRIAADAASDEANRGLRKTGMDEDVRHHQALEARYKQLDEAKATAAAAEELEKVRSEFDDLIAQLRDRDSFFSETKDYKALDTDRKKLGPDKKPLVEGGSYRSRAERAIMLLEQLRRAKKEGRYKGVMPDDVYDYAEMLELAFPTRKES